MATVAVSDRAGDRREHEHRNLAAEGGDPEQRGRAGEPVDEPRLGHRLHPRAGDRDQLTAEEELIIAVTEGAIEVLHAISSSSTLPALADRRRRRTVRASSSSRPASPRDCFRLRSW